MLQCFFLVLVETYILLVCCVNGIAREIEKNPHKLLSGIAESVLLQIYAVIVQNIVCLHQHDGCYYGCMAVLIKLSLLSDVDWCSRYTVHCSWPT